MNAKQQRRASLRKIEDRKRKRTNGTVEPAHYRLFKACAQKAQLRHASKKGKAYRPLTPTELDDIASGATVYYVENQRSSKIEDKETRVLCAAYSASRRSLVEYFRDKMIDGKSIDTTDTDNFDKLWSQDIPQPTNALDVMLAALKDDRQRRLAELLANQSELEQITQDVGYKSWSAVTYAKRQIAKRLADYAPESHLMRAVREACELFIRSPFPKVEPSPQERDNDSRDDMPRPRRAKDTRPVDTAINSPHQTPPPTLYVTPPATTDFQIVEHNQTPTSYWDSPYVAHLEITRYQRWLNIFAR